MILSLNSLLAKSLAHWRYYSTYPTIQTASQAEHHIKPEIDIYTANLGKINKYNGPQKNFVFISTTLHDVMRVKKIPCIF